MGRFVSLGTVQKLSTLLPSTASAEDKLQVATMVAESATSSIGNEKRVTAIKKKLWPKALGALREQRLAAKQELKAVRNILEHANFDLDTIFPESPLKAANPAEQVRHQHKAGSQLLAFYTNTRTGDATWAAVRPEEDRAPRLVLAPDEGGPLYACYQFLALQNAKVTLNRDALPLVYCRMCELSGWLFRSKKSPWGTHAQPDDALMQLFGRDILKENGLDESGDARINFTRVVEILEKEPEAQRLLLVQMALMDEELCHIFLVARNIVGLKLPADVKFGSGAEALEISVRRSEIEETVLKECFGMVLASAHELEEYCLYLRRAPACAAALLSPGDENSSTKEKVLSSMRSEWQTVLHMESTTATNCLLKDRCKFTDFQNFREIHTMMEQSEYAVTDAARSLLESWHPPFAWSANLESVFADVQSAIKRTCSSEQTSMQSMMSLAVRSLDRRVCTDDASPTPMTLEPNDFLGKQTANLKQKIWLSLDILDEKRHLWAAQCLGSGDLLRMKDEFFIVTGRSPSMVYAVRMKELPWQFCGELPAQILDETKMPRDPKKAEQAKFMLYTLHLAPDALASKLGCGLLVRRGTVEYDLLPYLVETKKLLRLPSASLSDLLAMQNVRMAKNTTVACKIRRLVCEDEVKAACSEKVIQEILQILDLRDEKKKESKDKDDDKDESEEYKWQELDVDPAVTACRELLAGMDDVNEDEGGDEDEPVSLADPPHEDASRISRSLLSSTSSIPNELVAKYDIPDNCHVHKTVFRDKTLPHYQAKLLGGRVFDGKQSTSASFNPALPMMDIDEKKVKALSSVKCGFSSAPLLQELGNKLAIPELSTLWNYTEQQRKEGKVRALLQREAGMAYMPENPEEMLSKCSDAWKSHLGRLTLAAFRRCTTFTWPGLTTDSKTGQFQAVGEIVHLTEPILEAQNICLTSGGQRR
ncbi:unnamed protein product, partial [Symbiodinium sp. KB8]